MKKKKINDDSQRDKYKLVSLISINVDKRGSHIAVRDALEDAGFDAAQDLSAIRKMIDDFKARHAPIKELLFSGPGINLQKKYSVIKVDLSEFQKLGGGLSGYPLEF